MNQASQFYKHDKKPNKNITVGLTVVVFCYERQGWVFPTGEVEVNYRMARRMAERLNNRNYPLKWRLRNG